MNSYEIRFKDKKGNERVSEFVARTKQEAERRAKWMGFKVLSVKLLNRQVVGKIDITEKTCIVYRGNEYENNGLEERTVRYRKRYVSLGGRET